MRCIIGIDEVGRGPLAGPVVVCALAIPLGLKIKNAVIPAKAGIQINYKLGKLKDSKKLTAKQREVWYHWIKNHPRICYALSRVYPKGIDRLNISKAANVAATRAFQKVYENLLSERGRWHTSAVNVGNSSTSSRIKCKILLDGGLYLRVNPRSYPHLSVSTRIKGDEKFTSIKLASIVAKVTRDAFMKRLHKKYPQYGFDRHKGYGTRVHILALKKLGPCKLHRRSFIKNFV